MKIIARWNIDDCGWTTFENECVAYTFGRTDLKLMAVAPGKLILVSKEL